MKCPSCATANPDIARFCMGCGGRLPLVCPACKTELPAEAKFCFNCGERLAAGSGSPPVTPSSPPEPASQIATQTPSPAVAQQPVSLPVDHQPAPSPAIALVEQRKLVSVLFADLAGFTAMSEKMDIEDVREIQQAYFAAVVPAIHQHGGIVEKYVGDAVMAVFGLPQTKEDDPERAVRAALGMQQGLAQLNIRLEVESGQRLSMRVGVNTGPVLATYRSEADFVVTGDTVNLASRLQSNAMPGGVLISNDTYRHVRGVFDVEILPPVQVKGKTDPIQVYDVRRARPRALRKGLRSVEGIATRLIGRQAEIDRLKAACQAVRDGSNLQFITLVAEAGLGKSRLLYELEIWSEVQPNPFFCFSGRANPGTQNVPYSLFREIFSTHFQIQDSDPRELVWQKLEQGIASVISGDIERARPERALAWDDQLELRSHFIGALLGFDFHTSPHLDSVFGSGGKPADPQQLHDRGLLYLYEFFRAVVERQPVLLLLDDLQWADESALDALDYLARRMEGQAMLIVAATRPSLFERRPRQREGQNLYSVLAIPPLTLIDSRRLVDEILQKVDQVPDPLRERIVVNAEGNPLYLEELVKMLVEQGVVKPGEEHWEIDLSSLEKVKTPPTLAALLQARIDLLPLDERLALSRAAVIGRLFWDGAVAYLNDPLAQPLESTRRALSGLRSREIIFQRDKSSFVGTLEFIFKGSLLREAAYENILKRDRRNFHARLAEWLRARGGERVGELIGQIADNLALAGQVDEASSYLEQAGDQAAAHFANSEAIRYYSQALDILPPAKTERRFQLLLAREQVLDLTGQRHAQQIDLQAMQELAESLGVRRQAESALRLANYAIVSGDYQTAVQHAHYSIDYAQTADDLLLQTSASLQLSSALHHLTDITAAHQAYQQTILLVHSANGPTPPLSRLEADSLRGLGSLAQESGDFPQAHSLLSQAQAIYQEIGDRRGAARTLNVMGILNAESGDLSAALNCFQDALQVFKEIGDPYFENRMILNLGNVALLLGDYSIAQQKLKQALVKTTEIGDLQGRGSILLSLGNVFYELGDYQSSRDYYAQSLAIAERTQSQHDILLGLNMSFAEHALGDLESAEGHLHQALKITAEIGDRISDGYDLQELGEVFLDQGRLAEAAELFERVIVIRDEIGQEHLNLLPLASLAGAALLRGQPASAMQFVETALPLLIAEEAKGDPGTSLLAYLRFWQALDANQDPRAAQILETAHTLLTDRASRISDPLLRRGFIENIPWHQQIIQAFDDH